MKTSRELRQEQGELVHQSRAILDRAEAEKRKRTSEEEAELRRIDADLDALDGEIERVTKLETREARLTQPLTPPAERPAVFASTHEGSEDEQRKMEDSFAVRYGMMGRHIARRAPGNKLATRQYRNAFDRYLTAQSVASMTAEEQRTLTQGSAAGGGYTVPQEEFVAELIKTADNESVIRGLARKFQVPQAQSLGAPSLSADASDPDWTTELAVGSLDSTMAFGRREMRPNPLAKYIRVSDKLLRSSPLGMEAIVRDRLAYKMSVAQSTAFNTGTGINQPLGVYTADANGISTARDVEVVTSTALDSDKFITARFTLRQPYWPNARWHLHRTFLAKIRQLKSDLAQGGNYLWQPGLTVGAPNTFLDFPYVTDEYAPSYSTSYTGYVAILGDFNNYWIADALDVRLQRVDELFALTNEVAFIVRCETDGAPVNEDAFVRIKATSLA